MSWVRGSATNVTYRLWKTDKLHWVRETATNVTCGRHKYGTPGKLLNCVNTSMRLEFGIWRRRKPRYAGLLSYAPTIAEKDRHI